MTTQNEIKPLTPVELAEARELEQAATAGPWEVVEQHDGGDRLTRIKAHGKTVARTEKMYGRAHHDTDAVANAAFSAAARTLVPRLLDDNEELRHLLDLAYAAVKYADMEHDEERCAGDNPFMMCAGCHPDAGDM